MKYLYLFLLLMNLLSFTLMAVDKSRAIRRRWRIPERTLFLVTVLGGGLGGCLGMWLLRHKTRHLHFAIGFPVILAAQLVLLFLFASPLG